MTLHTGVIFRSAAQPAVANIGKRFTTATPPNGLAVIALNGHFCDTLEDMSQVATSVNAATATIADAGQRWLCPHPAASIIINH